MSDVVPTQSDELRKALFIPCETKQDLHDWLELYLGIDFPDVIVNDESTTSPMGFIWTIYNAFRCRRFNLPEQKQYEALRRLMAYSSRDSYKTLGAAALEVAVLLHMSLSVAHMAAISTQSKKAQSYVKAFFRREYLSAFLTKQNEGMTEVVRFVHRVTGEVITEDAHDDLTVPEQDQYDRHWNYISIVICTMQGANSEHVPFFVVDEVDVVPTQHKPAYEEARAIASPWENVDPITLYISTRKFSWALVQQELDNAPRTGLQVLHWNIIDVTRKCEPERHLPDEPKIPIYHLDPGGQQSGEALGEADYKLLPPERQQKYRVTQGYAGCLKNCKLFFACRGQLATKQTGDSKLLRKITHVQGLFGEFSPGMANAQLMCNKPSEEGLIYPRLNRDLHMRTAAQMAQMLTGDPFPPSFTKAALLGLMKQRSLKFASGMDHGYTHLFTIVTAGRDGHRAFIVDVQAVAELELDHKVALIKNTIKPLNPRIWGDPAGKTENIHIRKNAGVRVMEWEKGPDSVTGGIELARKKIFPAIGKPEVFFLAGDPGIELLWQHLTHYHWSIDAAGQMTDVPDEENDDLPDAFRYLLMNEFPSTAKPTAGKDDLPHPDLLMPGRPLPTEKNYLTRFIEDATGGGSSEESGTVRGKSGGFFFDI